MAYIYGIQDPRRTGLASLRYVGMTTQRRFNARMASHIYAARTNQGTNYHKNRGILAILAAGYKPQCVLLDEAPDDEIAALEADWIAWAKEQGAADWNVSAGHDFSPFPRGEVPQAVREILRRRMLDWWENHPEKRKEWSERFSGPNNPFYGRKHSIETKNELSRKNKGRLVGSRNPNYGKCGDKSHMFGRKHRGESIQKMQQARKDWWDSHPEARSKWRDFKTQWHHEHLGFVRGEQNPRAKLTEDKVREIRALWSTGEWSHSALAQKFEVGKSTVTNVLLGKTWKHVE